MIIGETISAVRNDRREDLKKKTQDKTNVEH